MPIGRVQLIGLCRFSYKTSEGTGFAATNGVNEMDRLRARMELFKRLWVPSVTGQTDKRFLVVVLIGTGLPGEIRDQLVQAIGDCPQIQVHTEPDGQPHNQVCHKVLTQFRDPQAEIIGEFGLDDDDAVSLDFVAEVYRYAPAIAQILSSSGRAELDFSRGYAARIVEGGVQLKEVLAPHWNCGQVIFQRLPSTLSLFNFHHFRFWKRHPCLLAAQRPMFIRSFHANNDSGDRWDKLRTEASSSPPEFAALIELRFGISLNCDGETKLVFP